jgi:hypothetical protein
MTPEQESRQDIDRQLVQAGWIVQDYRDMNISAGPGVAVREFPLATGCEMLSTSGNCCRNWDASSHKLRSWPNMERQS